MSYATAVINTQALQHNVSVIRKIAPQQKIIAMIKANAYGHGAIPCAEALLQAGVDALGVAQLNEGKILKQHGIEHPIVLMDGVLDQQELEQAVDLGFQIVLHQARHLHLLKATSLSQPIKVWLKIDTGMNRLGVILDEAVSCWELLTTLENVVKPFGLMTHFANADSAIPDFTANQIKQFYDITRSMQGDLSLANSAGILAWPDSHGDWLRPGIMLYGVSPFADKTGLDHGLQPVMTLKSKIISIKTVRKGDSIGYGSTWCCPNDMNIGVIGLGYGDGYPRYIPNKTPVLVNGQVANIVGRVSMDMITVDLSQHPEAKIGDEVVLWGEGLPVEVIADYANTIPYELLCQITARVDKEYSHHT